MLVLGISAFWGADIRWLHFFQAWMYPSIVTPPSALAEDASTESSWAFGPPEQMKILLVTPAQAGVHVPGEVDSRFRGNDVVGVIFRRATSAPGLGNNPLAPCHAEDAVPWRTKCLRGFATRQSMRVFPQPFALPLRNAGTSASKPDAEACLTTVFPFSWPGPLFTLAFLADGVLHWNSGYDHRPASSIQAHRGPNSKGTDTHGAGVQFRGFRDTRRNVLQLRT
jgi:hypothetical protein